MIDPELCNARRHPSPCPWTPPPRKRLGEILIERGKLDAAGLERALRLQQDARREARRAAGDARASARSATSPRRWPRSSGCRWSTPPATPSSRSSRSASRARFLREARALPVREDEHELALAMADPTDEYTIGAFRMVTGREVRPMVAIPTELEAALERLYGAGKIRGRARSSATSRRAATSSPSTPTSSS